nr:MAG TPA: Cytosine specific methyltransferase [Caudoviricetes sp.]
MQCEQVGKLSNKRFDQSARVYGISGVSPTLRTFGGGGQVTQILDNRPVVRVAEATKKGFAEATIGDSINLSYPESKTRRGRVGKGVAQTLTCSQQQAVVTGNAGAPRIRRLTPKECWRLMGFDDEDFEKARAVNSDTQLYKQAGNSIVVNVLEAILGNLLEEERSDWLDGLLGGG